MSISWPSSLVRNISIKTSPVSTYRLENLPDEAGVRHRLNCVDKHLETKPVERVILTKSCVIVVSLDKKLVPLNHCHCLASLDSGNNSRQQKLILTGLNLPLYNKHPEM